MRNGLLIALTAVMALMLCAQSVLADTEMFSASPTVVLLAVGAGVVTILNVEQMVFMGGSKTIGFASVAIGGSLAVASLIDEEVDPEAPWVACGILCATIGALDVMLARQKPDREAQGVHVLPAIQRDGALGLVLIALW